MSQGCGICTSVVRVQEPNAKLFQIWGPQLHHLSRCEKRRSGTQLCDVTSTEAGGEETATSPGTGCKQRCRTPRPCLVHAMASAADW